MHHDHTTAAILAIVAVAVIVRCKETRREQPPAHQPSTYPSADPDPDDIALHRVLLCFALLCFALLTKHKRTQGTGLIISTVLSVPYLNTQLHAPWQPMGHDHKRLGRNGPPRFSQLYI
jgi:hypothetical protein